MEKARRVDRNIWIFLGILCAGILAFPYFGSDYESADRRGEALRWMIGSERLSKWEDEWRREADYRKWTAERSKGEIEEEAKRSAIPAYRCADLARAVGPRLCVILVGANQRPFGSPVEFELRWMDIPADASIKLAVRSAAPAGQQYRYAGPDGMITRNYLRVSRSGRMRIRWNGKSVACAPTDFPMMCDYGEVGRYVIFADVYTGNDRFYLGWPPLNPKTTRFLATSQPLHLTFTGLPRRPEQGYALLGSTLGGNPLDEALDAAIPKGLLGNQNYWGAIERLSPWYKTLFSYCSDLPLQSPLAGKLTVCFPRSRRDINGIALQPGDFKVYGDMSYLRHDANGA